MSITFCKDNKDAVVPTKAFITDAGFDLTIIKKVKDFNESTALYDTGIKVQVPVGYYTQIVPRSSLSKSGYMLANSIGIIDQTYTGNLFVALTKINQQSPNIELPFKCAQLLICKQYDLEIVIEDNLTIMTERGSGGFGSTG